MNSVDIVVPVYNERANFGALYERLRDTLRAPWRLLVVYDTEEDTTLPAVKLVTATDARVHLVRNSARGVSQAIQTGFKHAEAEAVLVIMVDDPPSIIEKIDELVEQFYAQQATVAVASRYMRGGSHTGGPVLKGFLSRLAGVSLHYVIGLPTHDATYATRLYSKAFLNRTTIESNKGFVLTIELTLKAYFAGEKIIEIPVAWQERTIGDSRFDLKKWLPEYLRWYFWGLKMRYIPFVLKKS